VRAFPDQRATQALAAAAEAAAGCRKPGDPGGVVRVEVTFAASGRVSAAAVQGEPFAGSRTARCIVETMNRVVIPAFAGAPMTLSQTVNVL